MPEPRELFRCRRRLGRVPGSPYWATTVRSSPCSGDAVSPRAEADELVHEGLQWRNTPREVAEAADVLSDLSAGEKLFRRRRILSGEGKSLSPSTMGASGQAKL